MTDSGTASTERRPVEVFVAADGNAFMADIAAWLVEAAGHSGRRARLVADGSLPGEAASGALSVVVAPHEFYELSTRSTSDLRRAATSAVAVATEQPGTSWYEVSRRWCERSAATLDINAVGAEALVSDGVDARWLRLGAVPSMDRRPTGEGPGERHVERHVDVTVLAGLTPHRARRLAGLAPILWRYRCDLRLFPTDRPVVVGSGATGPVFGRAKYELLAGSRVLLNLHRSDGGAYLEWARVVEAMANGCVVVTERAERIDPLLDGVHLVMDDDVGSAIEELIADPERIDRIGAAAAHLVHGELSLVASFGAELDRFDGILDNRLDGTSDPRSHRSLGALSEVVDRVPRPPRPAGRHRDRQAFRPHLALRRDLFDAVVAERSLRREIDAVRCRHRHGAVDHVDETASRAWADRRPVAAGRPAVSAIVTLFDYADVVTDALDSLAASTDVDVEIVVVDDHSTDGGRDVVRGWIDRHADVPVLLLGRNSNGGLAAARNLAISRTTTDRVMVLDADNAVYPTCLGRLAAALDDDPESAFAWSILEVFGDEPGLLSAYAWDPARLLERNQIDAQVMLRRSAWERLGGYRELPGMLAGWEDWDLWLRIAELGAHGVLVPEMLGRYRAQSSSMVSGPNRFGEVMLERFRELHPGLVAEA